MFPFSFATVDAQDPEQYVIVWLFATFLLLVIASQYPRIALGIAVTVLFGTATVLVLRKDINA